VKTTAMMVATAAAVAMAALVVSCSQAEQRGIGRLVEVGSDVADGQRDYYGPSGLDTDGDGVPNDVDRFPMDRESIYLPNDNREEDKRHE